MLKLTRNLSVRNQYAHRWDENEIFYGEKLENGKNTKLTIITYSEVPKVNRVIDIHGTEVKQD